MRPSAKEARSRRTTRTLSVLLVAVAVMMLLAPQVAPAQRTIRVYIDGRLAHFDVPPTIIQGRVLVPLRGVFEQLGANVDYDARTQHIVAIRGAQIVELTIGSRQATGNGAPRPRPPREPADPGRAGRPPPSPPAVCSARADVRADDGDLRPACSGHDGREPSHRPSPQRPGLHDYRDAGHGHLPVQCRDQRRRIRGTGGAAEGGSGPGHREPK